MKTADEDHNATRTTEVPPGPRKTREPHSFAGEKELKELAVAAERSVFLIVAWPKGMGHSVIAEFQSDGTINRQPGQMAPTEPRVYVAMDVEGMALSVRASQGLDPDA